MMELETTIDDQMIISEPAMSHVEIDGNHRMLACKSGFQIGRNINWNVMLMHQDRIMSGESLTFKETISAGLLFSGVVTVMDLKDETVAYDLEVSEEKDAFALTIHAPFKEEGYRIHFITEIAPHYFDESFRSTFAQTGVVEFNWQQYNLDGTLGPIVPIKQSLTAAVPFESRLLSKIGSYNPYANEITWQVIVNPFNVHITSGMLTEDLSFEANDPTTYIPNSFVTTSLNEEIALAEVSEDLKILFISIGDIGKTTHTFTFKVKVD